MKFNSKSVTLNRGINLKVNISLPSKLSSYNISPDIWEESIKKFNKDLDERSQVSEIIKGIKTDVLRINKSIGGGIVLWMNAKEEDVDLINQLQFTLAGKIIFEDDKSDKIEGILIKDLLYGSSTGAHRSIFKKRS